VPAGARPGRCSFGRTARRKAVQTDPSDPWNQIESARVAILRGERELAIGFAREALSLRPNMPEGFRCWAQALAFGGDIGQAILKYQEGSERSPRTRGVCSIFRTCGAVRAIRGGDFRGVAGPAAKRAICRRCLAARRLGAARPG
jgi:hypothetical protein